MDTTVPLKLHVTALAAYPALPGTTVNAFFLGGNGIQIIIPILSSNDVVWFGANTLDYDGTITN